jgi:hypothetical protein
VALAALACDSGSGSGGRAAVTVESSPGCRALAASAFPPGFDLLPGPAGRAVALSFEPPGVVPLDLGGESPVPTPGVPVLGIPDDSDGDGVPEGSGAVASAPQLDGVFTADPELAAAGLGLVTASGYEEVIAFRPGSGVLTSVEIEVDAGFAPADFRRLPAPGTSALRTAVSTDACMRPEAPIDSNGGNYAAGVPAAFFCDPAVAGSFYARFTSGAAVAAGRLFVSMSNLGQGGGTANATYLPGAVLVYDVDASADPPWVSPQPDAPVIETFAYNPTHVTRLAAGDREFVLVTLSGALGILPDDPGTPAVETGSIPLSEAAVEVIDAGTLAVVARTPSDDGNRFGFAFDRLAVHPSGRVAVAGSVARRSVYVVDLGNPAALPDTEAELTVLPAPIELAVPARAGGPPPDLCAGWTAGVAFDHAGGELYVTDRCDGTLTRFRVSLPADVSAPVLASQFALVESRPVVAPLTPGSFSEVRDIGSLRVWPGVPLVDFTGPDVFFLTAQPNAQACALRVASQ